MATSSEAACAWPREFLFMGLLVIFMWGFMGLLVIFMWVFMGLLVIFMWAFMGLLVIFMWAFMGLLVIFMWAFMGLLVIFMCSFMGMLHGYLHVGLHGDAAWLSSCGPSSGEFGCCCPGCCLYLAGSFSHLCLWLMVYLLIFFSNDFYKITPWS